MNNDSLSFKNIFKRETKLASYMIVCLTIVVLSLSYAIFFQIDKNSKNQVVKTGDLTFTYADGVQITSTSNSSCFEPMSADDASLVSGTCSYQFSVTNSGTLSSTYTLALVANAANTMENTKLKVILKKQVDSVLTTMDGYPKTISTLTDGVLISDTIGAKETVVYSAQIYVDESVATSSDTTKVVSYQIQGTGVVNDAQDINTTPITDKIIATLDTSGSCPTVNGDGTVAVSAIEGTKSLLCSAPDDYGTSYYYRGNVTNNYVKLGSYYFRIIRINGDGSIRMIYDGTSAHANSESSTDRQIGTSAYNYYWKKDNVTETTNSYIYYDNAGVGYMYGNRDGVVEASTDSSTWSTSTLTNTYYYATSYTYDAATDRFSLVSPVGVLGSATTSDYVGYYTCMSTTSTGTCQSLYKVTSVTVGTSLSIGYRYVIYGTTSKEKAQANTNDSTIKTYLDNWYQTNLSSYSSYFSDTLYCNDRSLYSSTPTGYSQLGYGPEKTAYRLYSYSNPRLKCSQQNDRFTVDDTTTGNGSLTYPIGLVTLDEAALAGGWSSSNSNYYLYTGNWYWTASPFYNFGIYSNVRFVDSSGYINYSYIVNVSGGVRPVFNLKSEHLISGSGTSTDPYIAG